MVTDFSLNATGRKPEMCDLTYIEDPSGTKSVQIIDRVQAKWRKLVDLFRLPAHTINTLRAMPDYSPENACWEVFSRWLEGGDDLLTPKNWITVVEVMCHIGNSALADEIVEIVSKM